MGSFGAMVLGMVATGLMPSGWLFALTALAAIYFIILLFVLRATMPCPNCGRSPLATFDRKWPSDARVCVHCNHLLRD